MQTKRKSNIELLRIIAMLLVMIVHADFLALGYPSVDDISNAPISSFIRCFIESLSVVCVNLFILISGWFSIKFSIDRLISFLFQILFICATMTCILSAMGMLKEISVGYFWKEFFGLYWFIISYLVMYIFAPALNYFTNNERKENIEVFLVLFFILQTLFGFILTKYNDFFAKGYSPLSFMGLYVLGRYLHLYPNKFISQKPLTDIMIYLGMSLCTTILAIHSHFINVYMSAFYSYSSPLIIVASVYLFLAFSKLSFQNKLINSIAASCFAIYLVHCFPVFFKNIYLAKINEWFTNLNILPFFLFTALWIFCIAIFAVLIDKCRLYVWTLIKSKQIANNNN